MNTVKQLKSSQFILVTAQRNKENVSYAHSRKQEKTIKG